MQQTPLRLGIGVALFALGGVAQAATVAFSGVITADGYFPIPPNRTGEPVTGVLTWDESLAPVNTTADSAEYLDPNGSFTVTFGGGAGTFSSIAPLELVVTTIFGNPGTNFQVKGTVIAADPGLGTPETYISMRFYFVDETAGFPLPGAFGSGDLYAPFQPGELGIGGITNEGSLTNFDIHEVGIVPTPAAASIGVAFAMAGLLRRSDRRVTR